MNSTQAPSKPRVLVVDDEPLVCTMVARLMRRRYDVTTTTSSNEGLRLARSQDWDAILCDIMMPELSGVEFLDRLKDDGATVVHRIGFMTGGAFDPEVQVFLEGLGERGWLPKPFGRADAEAFIESIRARTIPSDSASPSDSTEQA